VINNFKSIESRTDAGALWENYVIAERMKYLHYHHIDAKQYFWRTTQQQEIDLVEEHQDSWQAYEFKLNTKATIRFPQTFTANYSNTSLLVISPANLEAFLMK